MARFHYIQRLTILMLGTSLWVGCSNTNFGGDARTASGKTPAKGQDSKTASASASSTSPAPELQTEMGKLQLCPQKPQHILIYDMKSGWWSGDGGTIFQDLLPYMTDRCKGMVDFEYHHLLQGSNTVTKFSGTPATGLSDTMNGVPFASSKLFELDSMARYTQVWVLSGSRGDSMDIRTTDAKFVELKNTLVSLPIPLFIGSGNGNYTHAAELAKALNLGASFSSTLPEGPVVGITNNVKLMSKLTKPDELKQHSIFYEVNSIAGRINVVNMKSSANMDSDTITINSGFDAIAVAEGKTVMAASSLGATRPVVLDAGLQRYYAIRAPETTETARTLANIAIWLELQIEGNATK